MGNKDERFSSLLDEIIRDGSSSYEDSEYKEDLEFAEKLSDLYSADKQLKKEVYKTMKNNRKKGIKIAAVAGILAISLSTTSFAQNFYETIKEVFIPSGRISVSEGSKEDNVKKLKEAEKNSSDEENKEEGSFALISSDAEDNWNRGNLGDIIKNETVLNPLVLGEGYKYEGAVTYYDNKDKSEYINIKYSCKDKEIILFERKSAEANGYSSGSSHVEKLNIDGTDAIYSQEGSLDFERDGLLVRITSRGADREQLIQIYKDLYLYN